MPAVPQVSSTFEHELRMFGNEEESAQQYFFGFLSLQLIPSKNPDVLRQMRGDVDVLDRDALRAVDVCVRRARPHLRSGPKVAPQHQQAADVGLERNRDVRRKTGLLQRRIMQGMDPQQAAAYVADKYDLTVEDVRDMRKAVGKWRSVYEARYREIRHKIFAHKGLNRADANKLMAKTNINEVKELLGFLHSLYMSLWQLHINGIAPNLTPATFNLPPVPGGSRAGERMYRESADLLYSMLGP